MGVDVQAKVVYSSLIHGRTGRDKLRGIFSILEPRPFTLNTTYGTFLCCDQSGPLQFLPNWETEVKKVIRQRERGTFVDVGANIGFYSVMAAKQGNTVIAIEPNPSAYRSLLRNIKSNGLESRILALNQAAWSENRWLRLECGKESDLSKIGTVGSRVQAVALDDVLSGVSPTLVKIDVEGSESHVLQGMTKTMALHHPTIVFEALGQDRLKACVGVFGSHGYSVTRLDRINYVAT